MPLEGRKKGPPPSGQRGWRQSPGRLSVAASDSAPRTQVKGRATARTYGENVVVDDAHAEHCLEEGVRELRLSRQERACFVRTGGNKCLCARYSLLSARSVVQTEGAVCARTFIWLMMSRS